MNKIAIITGATSGIGRATAVLLAKNKYDVIITGRRKERLDRLASEIIETHKVRVLPLAFDIRNNEEVLSAIAKLPEEWKNIDVLVNNAGLAAGLDAVQDGHLSDWEQMIDTNIKGLLYISKQIIPLMIARKQGHIVNIGSIAGKETYPKGNVYCATKHAVEALTKGMRMDLNPYGIKVSEVCPGMVETEFSQVRLKDAEANKKVYEGFTPLYAEDIAETILFMVTRPAHINIADVLILPTAQASGTIVKREL
ncbi:MAG: SDR family NAD(P)-dependent oxidoreductase [Flavobacteriaceae bacterium]|nr:SDR family NAD(P)-dependent oxidoreductase [Flavobacteriaceae bacterium]